MGKFNKKNYMEKNNILLKNAKNGKNAKKYKLTEKAKTAIILRGAKKMKRSKWLKGLNKATMVKNYEKTRPVSVLLCFLYSQLLTSRYGECFVYKFNSTLFMKISPKRCWH